MMVTGRLVVYKNSYYAMINLKHTDGRRYQKRINLYLPVINNKRKAIEKMLNLCQEYTRLREIQENSPNLVFRDVAMKWYQSKIPNISPSTQRGYDHMLEKHLLSYFGEIKIQDIAATDVEDYYLSRQVGGLSGTTVQHHHMLLGQIFQYAYRKEILLRNPMDCVQKPKRQKPNVGFYSVAEAQELWSVCTGHKLEIVIKMALFYGLRRSEILGLHWDDINFKENTVSINNSIVMGIEDGQNVVCEKSYLKEEACKRTMPLSKGMKKLLENENKKKKRFRSKYICTDSKGELIKPDEVTQSFGRILKKHGLRHIRFHDLRHTCASLLVSSRTPLIEVQHWLGHSTMLTTADLYSHLEYEAKKPNAETMTKIFNK